MTNNIRNTQGMPRSDAAFAKGEIALWEEACKMEKEIEQYKIGEDAYRLLVQNLKEEIHKEIFGVTAFNKEGSLVKNMKPIESVVKVDEDGDKFWYINGQLHREDGPAIEYADGEKWWYINGKLHREDGPAVEYNTGTKFWYINGQLHREDGPSCELANGNKFWYINGQRHREDGPAIELTNGNKQWFINDQNLTEQEFNARKNMVRNIN